MFFFSQDDEGECPTSLDSEFGAGEGLFEPRAVPSLVTLAAEAYLAIPNVWALERFIKKATPKVINSEKPQDIPSTISFNFCRNKYEVTIIPP